MIDNVQVPPFSQSFIPSRITRDGAVTAVPAVASSRISRGSGLSCGVRVRARCARFMYHDNVFFGYQSIARRVVPEAERAHKRVGEMDGAATGERRWPLRLALPLDYAFARARRATV